MIYVYEFINTTVMFHEKQFIDGFVKHYMENTNVNDVSLVFDEYIGEVVANNSEEQNRFIISTYETVRVPANLEYNLVVRTSCVLYDTFYREVEDAVEAVYEGDAETDGNYPTEYYE
jgi:hypothetical protein